MPSRHRVIIVGADSIGERHLRCFLATGRADVGFVEPRAEVRQDLAARYSAAAAFESLEATVDSFDPTAAVIATPAPLHVPLATRLAQRGVHLLIEKPLSLSMAGVSNLAEVAGAKGAVVAVGYVYRAHPALAAMRAAVVAGKFGQPLELVAVAGQCFPFYRPAYRETYYARRESGGGAVQDALTHVLDAGRWLVGPMDRVAADAARQAIAGVEVEDTVHAIARHGPVLASYSLNQHQAPNELTLTVVCERGTVRFEYHANRWRSMTTPGGAWAQHGIDAPLERDTLFDRQANAFLDAVEGTSPPLCPLADGIDTLLATTALLRSLDTGHWQQTTGEEAIAS
ncbi:MAG TPA: Gfo/Idh/MocA family oxidoreductase [Tepidisphaeraceae bacterium]